MPETEAETTEHGSLNGHDTFSLTAILNNSGEHCRSCSTPEYPIWRVLRGREIERCPNCGDETYDVFDFAEDDPY